MRITNTISSDEARRRFSELILSAFYNGIQTAITKNNKPVAWIVGEPFMHGLYEFIDLLEKNNPSLADTLALYLNEDASRDIERAKGEIEQGEIAPLASILDVE